MKRCFSKQSTRYALVAAIVATSIIVSGCDGNTNPVNPIPTPTNTSTGGPVTGNGLVNVTTYHNDLSRTGQNLGETLLTRSNVNSTDFGKIADLPVDGVVYAQPLVATGVQINSQSRNLVYVATEHDSVYAFDADSLSSTPVWHASFIGSPSDCTNPPCTTATTVDVNAPNVNPEIGITATPVIDPAAGVIYVTAFTKDSQGYFFWKLHELSLATGAEQPGSPITIDTQFPGMGAGMNATSELIYFDPVRQLSRAGLVLSNGLLYVAFSSFDDQEPTHGWLIAYNASTLDPVSAYMTTPNSGEGTIWAAGGAPAVDSAGNIYFSTGNGDPSVQISGQLDMADTVQKVEFTAQGFELADYFMPYNKLQLDAGDVEIGSGGVMLLPDQSGPFPHLMLAGGKEGTVYLLDRDNLGGFNASPTATNDPQIVQELVGDFPGGADGGPGNYSTPSYYDGSIFYGVAGAPLTSIPIENGLLDWDQMSQAQVNGNANTIRNRGATTSISANGGSNGIIWYMDSSAYTYGNPYITPTTLSNGPTILYAYSTDDLSEPLYASNQSSTDAAGCAVKFTVPTVANGQVFVGSDSEVSVYGLRAGVPATASTIQTGSSALTCITGSQGLVSGTSVLSPIQP